MEQWTEGVLEVRPELAHTETRVASQGFEREIRVQVGPDDHLLSHKLPSPGHREPRPGMEGLGSVRTRRRITMRHCRPADLLAFAPGVLACMPAGRRDTAPPRPNHCNAMQEPL